MKNLETDNHIVASHISWRMFITTFAVLTILTGSQALIYDAYIPIENVPVAYILGITGYWAIVSFIICLVANHQMFKIYDKPMRILSSATKQVSDGDFSVWLEPIHPLEKRDYMDIMFEDFNKMVEELESTQTLKDDFIASVSHEIKTPLSVIQNYAMALQGENQSPERREEYIATIVSASRKLSALVTNILKLNKLERQQITPKQEPYDLCRQLSDCALTFENLWEEKQIDFEADLEDRVMIHKDEGMLEIVWQNLLSNALKFTPPGGKVTLKETSDEETVTVSVSDTGIGIGRETMHHIFDKFYQGDSSHSQEGNGLGLALSKRVVEIARGKISVESSPGKGTTFLVTLGKE